MVGHNDYKIEESPDPGENYIYLNRSHNTWCTYILHFILHPTFLYTGRTEHTRDNASGKNHDWKR